MNVRFLHLGDTALVVEFDARIDHELSDRVFLLRLLVQAFQVHIDTVFMFT